MQILSHDPNRRMTHIRIEQSAPAGRVTAIHLPGAVEYPRPTEQVVNTAVLERTQVD